MEHQATKKVDRIAAVVPVLAEEESIRLVVEGLVAFAGDRLSEIRIIMAEAAPPATRAVCAQLVAELPITVVSEQRRGPGLGWAVRQGIEEARGDYILMIDGDGEMDVSTVPELIEAIEGTAAELAVASRWLPEGGTVGYGPVKLVLNRVFQVVLRLLYRTTIHDLTLGFKLGSASVLRAQNWTGRYHEIACETTLRLIRQNYVVVEVPTVWRRRVEGQSSNPFRRNFRYVKMALRILIESDKAAA